jgi:Spx/MgsR family transcriptional regulator
LLAIVAQVDLPHHPAMTSPSITLYGIPNCDTVKKARAWLDDQQAPYVFVDFKKAGVPPAALTAWLAAPGWETLLNRKGTTWRRLDGADRDAAVDATTACALMQRQPSVIKRPVVEWVNRTGTTAVTVGFDPARFELQLATTLL